MRERRTARSSRMFIWNVLKRGHQVPWAILPSQWPPHPYRDASVWMVTETGGGVSGTVLEKAAALLQGARRVLRDREGLHFLSLDDLEALFFQTLPISFSLAFSIGSTIETNWRDPRTLSNCRLVLDLDWINFRTSRATCVLLSAGMLRD